MPSLTTFYRAIVMIVTGVIVVQGWQLYGPSTEQVKTFVVAALEKAQAAWHGAGEKAANAPSPEVDPHKGAPPVIAETPPVVPAPITSPQLVPVTSAGSAAATPVPIGATNDETAVAKLLTQLEEMGGANAQVGPWGSSGELYRCCCRAKLADTSGLARHFEAVAGEPTAAVEQVVAKVEAWRTEQQNLLR